MKEVLRNVVAPLVVASAVTFGTYGVVKNPPKPIEPLVETVTGKRGNDFVRGGIALLEGAILPLGMYFFLRRRLWEDSESEKKEKRDSSLPFSTNPIEDETKSEKDENVTGWQIAGTMGVLTLNFFYLASLEEILFRLIPYEMFGLKGSLHTLITSPIFGALHFGNTFGGGITAVVNNSIKGVIYSQLFLNQGLFSSILYHTLNNVGATIGLIGVLLLEARRLGKEEKNS